jgi:NAD(P)-dependent dehydrogenase (short-subunit alcohol dehydrogenase family)
MSSTKQQRVVLVTGANKGIGFYIVNKLLNESSYDDTVILLGSRDLKRGQDALIQLGSPSNVHLLLLDMSSTESITQAVSEIKEKYNGQLDVVINNAGLLIKELTVDAARTTFAINYYGVKFLNEQLFPIMNKDGRIVNVSSQLGPMVLHESSTVLQEKYTSTTLTIEELDYLVESFISAIETNTLEDLGYHGKSPNLIYGISKAALNALSQVEARKWSTTKNLLVVSVSPGFCATDMTQNASAARSPELGADSILHAINTPHNELQNGGFYRDGKQLPFISEPIS